MRYIAIDYSNTLFLYELNKNRPSTNEAKKSKIIGYIEFKYEGKSACIYKENTHVENFDILACIYKALSNITCKYGNSAAGTVMEYAYIIGIGYKEMLALKCSALITPDNSIASALEKILLHVSMDSKQLIIHLAIADNDITAVTLNHHDITLDEWFKIRPLIAKKLPKLCPKALVNNKPRGLDFEKFYSLSDPHVFEKDNIIQYDILFKDGNYPEEKINKAQTVVKFIQKCSTCVLLRGMSFLIFLKRILLNPGFFQNLFASASGLWILQNISKFNWWHLF
ncbi:hypothetical protein [Bartonella sp. TP]|uniref:hypothetical protein n=1 Tax=Bartonella sp. TP TaxID=3057550 RepID=UPI0025AFF821|nr:hypothetical protein [Bartonella sp. TP]WJW79978.1 hypothetical protein QVL57_05625 [Bartonella sp. TP]